MLSCYSAWIFFIFLQPRSSEIGTDVNRKLLAKSAAAGWNAWQKTDWHLPCRTKRASCDANRIHHAITAGHNIGWINTPWQKVPTAVKLVPSSVQTNRTRYFPSAKIDRYWRGFLVLHIAFFSGQCFSGSAGNQINRETHASPAMYSQIQLSSWKAYVNLLGTLWCWLLTHKKMNAYRI